MDHIDTGISPSSAEARGRQLRDARVSKGYSLEDLAVATGLTEAEIAAIEDGTSTNVHPAERIEHALS